MVMLTHMWITKMKTIENIVDQDHMVLLWLDDMNLNLKVFKYLLFREVSMLKR